MSSINLARDLEPVLQALKTNTNNLKSVVPNPSTAAAERAVRLKYSTYPDFL